MEFLQESDGEEKDDTVMRKAEDQHDVVAPIRSVWTELSDSEDDDDVIVRTDLQGESNGFLPGANELLSSVVTQFAGKSFKDMDNATIQSKTYIPVVSTVVEVPIVQRKKPSSAGILVLSDNKVEILTGPRTTSLELKAIGASSKPVEHKSKDAEKDSAKDRVKRQRLNGQSGIGSDFKTWKSEEEMKQRQQYD